MMRLFLERVFSASRDVAIRKNICGIRQMQEETLYEYWERFKRLCASCPHHQISEHLLIQFFYEGLIPIDRRMIDVASGGALMDKTPTAAKDLIANMAENFQQFGSKLITRTRGVGEILDADLLRIEHRLDEMASLMKQLTMGHHVTPKSAPEPTKVCGIYAYPSHSINGCSQLQEDVLCL